MTEQDLVYDWNRHEQPVPHPPRRTELLDRTFELGGCPPDPALLQRIAALGVRDVSLPGPVDGAGLRQWALGSASLPEGLHGVLVEATGPFESIVETAANRDLEVTVIVSRAGHLRPEELATTMEAALAAGAGGVCLSDDEGHCTTHGVQRLLGFAREVIGVCAGSARLEWHGFNHRGLALSNALTALITGVDRLHCSFFGTGPEPGCIPTDLLLANLKLLDACPQALEAMGELVAALAQALGRTIPPNYPVFGADAFRTGTGVHAAAIIKAEAKGHTWLADRIYSGVPASLFGFRQLIEVGPMAGASNVHHWLRDRGVEADEAAVERILGRAKASPRVLTDQEIMDCLV